MCSFSYFTPASGPLWWLAVVASGDEGPFVFQRCEGEARAAAAVQARLHEEMEELSASLTSRCLTLQTLPA